MSGTSNQAPVAESPTDNVDQPELQKVSNAISDSVPAAASSARDEVERISPLQDTRIRVGMGGATLLVLAGSVVTAIYVRRQAEERGRRLMWLALKAGAGAALPGARQFAPLGGAGGSLLLLSLLVARMRRAAEADRRHDDFNPRQALPAMAMSEQPRVRDVLLGIAMGLGITNVLSRSR